MKLLADIWSLLDRRQRWGVVLMQLLTSAMALSTLAAIVAVAPFFAVLGDPTLIERNTLLSWCYVHFGFDGRREFLGALGLAFLTVVLISNALNLLGSLAMMRFAHRIGNHFCVALFDEYLRRDHQFHLAAHSATLFNNIAWEAARGTTGVLQSFFLLSANLATGLLIVISIVVMNPAIALTTIAALAGGYAAIYALARQRLLKNGLQESRYVEARTRLVSETLGAIREIIVLRAQGFFSDKFRRACAAISQSVSSTQAIAQSPRHVLECIVAAGLVGVTLRLIEDDAQAGTWLAQLSFLGFAAYRLLPALQQIFHAAVRIRADRVAFYRIAEDLRAARRSERKTIPAVSTPVQGAIQFHAVSFAYAGHPEPVIHDVNLTISPGDMIGLIGPSGSGKTTLVELMIGLLPPSSGVITVGGVPLDEPSRPGWWAQIAYVPQQIFLFDASLAENIAPATPIERIDFDRLREAIELAQLGALVGKFPQGHWEIIGERGIRLSGGQRQRVGLARAIYRRASVLVLDEATNALDGMTEGEILSALANLRGRCTIILIAHRLSTVQKCDRIIELRDGKIVQSGEPEQLANNSSEASSLMRGA